MLNPIRISKSISYAVIAIVTLLFSFILLAFPYAADDHMFLNEMLFEGPMETGSEDITDGLLYSFDIRFQKDTARIGNFLAIALLLVPRWIPMGLTCIIFFLGYLLAIKYATFRFSNLLGVTSVSFLLVFAPMWQDIMFSQMYAYNYIWSIPLLFGSLYIFLKEKYTPIWGAFALGLITAMWHECNAVTILGGGVITLIFHRDLIRKDRLMLLAGVTCGLAYLVAAPAWWNRGHLTSSYIQLGQLIYMWAFFIFCCFWVLCLSRRCWRKICFEPRSLIMLTAGIGLTILSLTSHRVRSAMPGMFLACATIPWIVSRMSQVSNWHISRPIRIIASLAMMAIILIHLIAVSIRTVDIKNQTEAVGTAIRNTPKDGERVSVFAPITYTWQASWITLLRPFREVFHNDQLSVTHLGLYYHQYDVYLIPEQLRSYRQGMGQPLPGNGDIRLYKDCIVSPHLSDTIYIGADVSYGNYTEHAPLTHAIFTGADGADYDYIWPARSLISSFLKTPTKFNFDMPKTDTTKE